MQSALILVGALAECIDAQSKHIYCTADKASTIYCHCITPDSTCGDRVPRFAQAYWSNGGYTSVDQLTNSALETLAKVIPLSASSVIEPSNSFLVSVSSRSWPTAAMAQCMQVHACFVGPEHLWVEPDLAPVCHNCITRRSKSRVARQPVGLPLQGNATCY